MRVYFDELQPLVPYEVASAAIGRPEFYPISKFVVATPDGGGA